MGVHGFVARVRETIEKYQMFQRGERVVVGVSGGPDSVALLYALVALASEYDLVLHVAHLNHMFRGEEAERDVAFVSELGRNLGLAVIVEAFNMPRYIEESGLSPEDASRRIRYAFYSRVAAKASAQKVALGHNADDQAETVLMRFLRGSGLTGLSGMAPVRREVPKGWEGDPIIIVRPLIGVTRQEIDRYCNDLGIRPRLDASNIEPVYLRNRLRMELIPLLERDYNPNLRGSLVRMSEVLRVEEEFIARVAEDAFRKVAVRESCGKVELDIKGLMGQPEALRRRIVRKAFGNLVEMARDLDFRHVEDVCDLLMRGPSGSRIQLPHNVVVKKGYKTLSFSHVKTISRVKTISSERGVRDIERQLNIPGVTEIPELGISIEARVIDMDQGLDVDYEYEASCRFGKRGCIEAFFDYEAIGAISPSFEASLKVRTRRLGDRFKPLGMMGTKKLKDFFIERKVPREERDKVPIVATDDRLVWVVGYRIDDSVKVVPNTRRLLHLVVFRRPVCYNRDA